ncbi:tyrosine-type recombinase/integrase [Algimonas ampicilliniresistens]|nr:site-specific integrase [Algimonas ampicilliniresistens]
MAGIKLLNTARINALPLPERGKRRVSDGGGLYLVLRATGSKAWVFLWKRNGQPTEIGLGRLSDLGLADARKMAEIARVEVAAGRDPREAFRPKDEKTFKDAALAVVEMKSRGREAKTRHQWERDLLYRCKTLHSRPIENVTRSDILKLLRPIWNDTPESGRRFRARLEALFGYAIAMKWRQGGNPAVWKHGLEHVLSAHTDTKGHHDAMPWQDVPAFMVELSERKAISAKALAFTILTAPRTNEALQAQWGEFDFSKETWTIPAERMKAKTGKRKPHTIPLSPQALAIIHEMGETKISDYVFPGQKRDKPLSNMAMLNLLQSRMKKPFTVHGFRSSFRDWVGETTDYPRELAEMALAHVVGNMSEQAYRRGKAIERRRPMMLEWAAFCVPSEINANVVRLHG